ncbi:hypothetical protein HME9302_02083 [Alteripontixanthobacter maritimus]|uniref:Beta-lactamase-related domain-containing protein n=1 Tax=Alteripontixanthobacter maritimus TaxID=2161824 RepID=A0A369QCA6_9SPHN|nr:serine hydrolase domain-containing protein [Alteripontixanthobacter maritimus]RDC60867.1 hypothetical protein HME9302_02083 [Alteripontixanthobacter maritimus]
MDKDLVRSAVDSFVGSLNLAGKPGVSMALAQGGKVITKACGGMLHPEHGGAITDQTPFRIGSTSKQFTAAAALLLERDGLLDLDASIRDQIPELPKLLSKVRLRHMLSCTSGMHDELDMWLFANGLSFMPQREGFAQAFARDTFNFPAGSHFCYNNTGFALASLAMERATGLGFDDILREYLFGPAGLRATSLVARDDDLPAHCARTALPSPTGFTLARFPAEITGEGGLISTPSDLLRWNRWLQNIDQRQIYARMSSATPLKGGGSSAYGLGLIKASFRGVTRVHHPGGVIGGSAQLVSYPDADCTIAVASNNGAIAAPDLADRLAEQLGILPPAPLPAESGPTGQFYDDAMGRGFSLNPGELDLHVQRLPLYKQGDATVAADSAGMGRLAFECDGQEVWLHEHGQTRRLDPIAGDAAMELPASPFCYRNTRLSFEGRQLLVEGGSGSVRYDLRPMGQDTYAAVPTLPVPLLATVKAESEGLRVSTLRNWNMRCDGAC